MSGWYAQDCARWDRTRQRLLAHGPLDEEDARNDLACLESLARLWIAEEGRQGARWPGRREIAKRWGWTDREVRTLLARDDWHDPRHPVPMEILLTTTLRAQPMDIARSAPGQRPVSARSAPGQVQDNAEESEESARSAPGQRPVSARSTSIRAVPSPQGSQDHKITGETISPAVADVAPLPAPALVSPEAQPSPPPAPPTKPTRPPKAPKPEPRACPGYSEAIALWTRLHREAFPGIAAYPWLFGGRDSDAPRVKLWLAAVHIGPEAAPERVADGLAALDTGIRAYLARVATGTAWPAGEPATTRVFTRDLSRWLQTDPDGATSTGPPSKLAAAFQGTQRFLDRHRDEENVDGIF